MNILVISNSFGDDAARNLHDMALSSNENINITNLYIGGCPLELHWKNVLSGEKVYEHKVNGNDADMKCSIFDALNEKEWDVVVTQQASGFSGIKESYNPYLENLIDYVLKYQPKAQLYLQQTWAYDFNSDHPDFSKYKNEIDMYNKLTECYLENAKRIGAKVIPSGKIINELRKVDYFDLKKGGKSLTRDGFHMSYDYGRYAVSATWLFTLTGKLPSSEYLPLDEPNVDKNILKLICETIKSSPKF